MTHLPVTYKDLVRLLHPFNNTIYNFFDILILNSSNQKKKIIIIIELIIRNNDIYFHFMDEIPVITGTIC